MFFNRASNLLKSAPLKVFSRKFSNAPLCPHVDKGKKHQYAKPDCSHAIIIGGTGAIGLAAANQLFCSKAKKIALIDTDPCKGKDAVTTLNCAFGKEKAIFIKADVTDKHDIEDAFCRIKDEFKTVDMVINAFGVWDENTWKQEVKVNLAGTINANIAAKQILPSPGGFILNIIGIPGIEVFPPCPALAASYMGVVAFTQASGHKRAMEITGIRVAALCCGITESDFVKNVEKKACCPQMGNELKRYLADTCWQKPEAVGKAVIEVYKFAPTGTIWLVEGSRLFFLRLPNLNQTRELENQFI